MKILEPINWQEINSKPEHEMQRLLHGRSFQVAEYAHVNIDWLSPVVLIILYKEVQREWLEELSETLLKKND